MAMEPVEFGFEDLDKQDFKVEVEGRASEKEVEVEVPQDKKPEVEIEIVDDTPPKDRGRDSAHARIKRRVPRVPCPRGQLGPRKDGRADRVDGA